MNGWNCAQAVVKAWPELYAGCESAALKLSFGFGGGMGRLQETCGAVTGAFMVIGLFRGSEHPDDAARDISVLEIREFRRRFNELHNSLRCIDLIRVDLNTEEGREAQKRPEVKEKTCLKCVTDSVRILEDILLKR